MDPFIFCPKVIFASRVSKIRLSWWGHFTQSLLVAGRGAMSRKDLVGSAGPIERLGGSGRAW
jgi:hypothetical protein